MKILVIETIAATPHLETAGEIALRLKQKKHNVSFAWVGFNLPWNDWELSLKAKALGGSFENKVHKFSKIIAKKDIKVERVNSPNNYDKIYKWSNNFNGNLSQLKNYKYDGCKLGAGVASSLISNFRDVKINLKKYKSEVRKLLYASGIVYERTKKILEESKPQKIYTFNNRFATCYAVICAATKLKIKIIRHERGCNISKFETYEKNVHDIDLTQKNILRYWIKNKNKNKIKKANQYFWDKIKKKSHKLNYNTVFTKKQISKSLPPLPTKKRIVTFYTSNDYEKASIVGMKFDQLKEFKKFKKVIDTFKDIHLVVRVHPKLDQNFGSRKIDDDADWIKFKDNKTTIIKSFENFDTYALMFRSDIVVTYTSSILVESAFFKKPSVSIGKFWWSGLNIAEEAYSINQLKNILNKNYKFKNRNINNCLKVANYFLNFGIKYKYYNPITSTKGKFLNEKLTWKSKFILFIENIFKKII